MSKEIAKTFLYYATISERIICLKIRTKHHDMVIIQIHAPNEFLEETEKAQFSEELRKQPRNIKIKRSIDCDGRLQCKSQQDKRKESSRSLWMGDRNENAELLIDVYKEELVVTNTWFEQRHKNRYTWVSPDGESKNQIDFILMPQRYRNSVKNAKVIPSADY